MSRIYPEWNTIRRNSEPYEKPPPTDKFNLERNCNQIFMRGPALTKDFLEKMHHEIGPSRTYIFGYEMKTRQFWFLTGLILLFSMSFTGTIVMWLTNIFYNSINSNLALANNSDALHLWQHVGAKPLIKFHIYNYTNLKEYESNQDEKLKVQLLGPYVYEEQLERINLVRNSDDTLSYQEKRSFKFRADLSKGRQSDMVNVPNIPLISGAAVNKKANFFQRVAFNSLLETLSEQPFMNIAVHRYITGYNDDLYDISKSILKLQNEKPYERFGLLTSKAGIQPTVYTINTGVKDINKLGQITSVDNQTTLPYWSTDECNSIQGGDGAIFPPKAIKEKHEIHYYLKAFCRSVPLQFEKEVTLFNGKIPAYQYIMPTSIFDHPDRNPLNQCFCNLETGVCPLQGVIDVTSCTMGSPMFISMPHFYNADESLINGVDGIKKDVKEEDVISYSNYHPTMGYFMTGVSRLQANIQVHKSFGISKLNFFKNDLMLPLTWFEFGLDESLIPEDLLSIIYQTTFTVKGIELGLKYGCLLSSIITLVCIFIVVRNKWETTRARASTSSSTRPVVQSVTSSDISE